MNHHYHLVHFEDDLIIFQYQSKIAHLEFEIDDLRREIQHSKTRLDARRKISEESQMAQYRLELDLQEKSSQVQVLKKACSRYEKETAQFETNFKKMQESISDVYQRFDEQKKAGKEL